MTVHIDYNNNWICQAFSPIWMQAQHAAHCKTTNELTVHKRNRSVSKQMMSWQKHKTMCIDEKQRSKQNSTLDFIRYPLKRWVLRLDSKVLNEDTVWKEVGRKFQTLQHEKEKKCVLNFYHLMHGTERRATKTDWRDWLEWKGVSSLDMLRQGCED